MLFASAELASAETHVTLLIDAPGAQPKNLTHHQRFMAALAGQPVDHPPVWLMRQAGRYLPEYRAVRQKHTFLQMVHTPEVAIEITLQPLRRFPIDAAILFSDILTIPEAMGITVDFPEGGPVLSPTVRSLTDIEKLPGVACIEKISYVAEALRGLRSELGDSHALLGFSGAPFTLASYIVEGKGTKSFEGIKSLMYSDPKAFVALLDKLTDLVIAYLKMQLDAGADAVQLFDSWASELRDHEYRQFVLPSTQRIAQAIADHGGKLILFARNPGHLLDATFEVPCQAYGIDQRVDLAMAARKAKALGRSLQGALDPIELFAPPEHIQRRVLEMADAMQDCGWIANLGHGVVPQTPISGVEAYIAAVQGLANRA